MYLYILIYKYVINTHTPVILIHGHMRLQLAIVNNINAVNASWYLEEKLFTRISKIRNKGNCETVVSMYTVPTLFVLELQFDGDFREGRRPLGTLLGLSTTILRRKPWTAETVRCLPRIQPCFLFVFPFCFFSLSHIGSRLFGQFGLFWLARKLCRTS